MDRLVAGYGRSEVLHQISLRIAPGEAVALLGANGAGKTTLLRAISGLLQPRDGEVRFGGERIDRWAPHRILKAGIAHVPEGRQVFAQQTVLENLLLGGVSRRDKSAVRRDLESLLDVFPALKPKVRQPAGELSGGQQQMLAIARGLMAAPSLLLIDEPSLGLAPALQDEVAALVQRVRSERNMGLLIVEQNAFMAAQMAERAYVMRNGTMVTEQSTAALLGGDDLVAAYLGRTDLG